MWLFHYFIIDEQSYLQATWEQRMQQQHAAIHFGKWEKGVAVVGKPQKLLTEKFSWKTTSLSAIPLSGDREEYTNWPSQSARVQQL